MSRKLIKMPPKNNTLNSTISNNEKSQQQYTFPNVPMITNEWISGSTTRNFILKDPLIDWLNLYGVKKGYARDEKYPDYDSRLDFSKYIMGQGNAFEALIMSKLKDKFGPDIVEVKPNSFTMRMKDTLNLMKIGTPIIAQGMIFGSISKTYGIPDLIVRNDYINKLVNTEAISNKIAGCKINPNWHYRIVDIKFSTLKLKANFTNLLNSGSQKAYKAQLCIYNNCLSNLQGMNPEKAYILGRGWEATKKNILYCSGDPFSKLGVINFEEDDFDIINDTQNAVDWRRKVLSKGESWQILPQPSVPELYPNMSNELSSGWDNVKLTLANTLKEITLLWQAGVAARENAHENQIYAWDDPRCSSKHLGISGSKMQQMVDTILNVNKKGNVRENSIILPEKIKSNIYDWRSSGKEFFIDFENVTSIFNLEDNSCNIIYMMGVGWIDSDGKWNHKAITVNSIDSKEEERIVREFINTIGNLVNNEKCPECKTELIFSRNHHGCSNCAWQYCPLAGWWNGMAQCGCLDFTEKINEQQKEECIKLYHYSHAEPTMFNRVMERIIFTDSIEDKKLLGIQKRFQLCDILTLIKNEPIIIKGALNFSLKSIVSALKDHGKINISYEECKVKSGTQALLSAIVASSQTTTSFQDHELILDCIKYNNIDCKSLYELLKFFRASM